MHRDVKQQPLPRLNFAARAQMHHPFSDRYLTVFDARTDAASKDARQVPTCPLGQVVKASDTVDFSNTTVDPPSFSPIDFVETDFESIETIHWTGFILSLGLCIITALSCIGFRRHGHQMGLWPDPIRYMQDRFLGARRSITRKVMHIEDKVRYAGWGGAFQWLPLYG